MVAKQRCMTRSEKEHGDRKAVKLGLKGGEGVDTVMIDEKDL